MIRESRFKRGHSKSYVRLGRPVVLGGNYSLVNHGWFKAIPGHRAVIWLPAVACSRRDVRVSKDGFIMPINFLAFSETTLEGVHTVCRSVDVS